MHIAEVIWEKGEIQVQESNHVEIYFVYDHTPSVYVGYRMRIFEFDCFRFQDSGFAPAAGPFCCYLCFCSCFCTRPRENPHTRELRHSHCLKFAGLLPLGIGPR